MSRASPASRQVIEPRRGHERHRLFDRRKDRIRVVLVVRTMLKRTTNAARDTGRHGESCRAWGGRSCYLMVFLKLPILALLGIVWWAIRQTPEEAEQPGDERRPQGPSSPAASAARRRAAAPAARPARRPAPPVAAARAHDRRTRPPLEH